VRVQLPPPAPLLSKSSAPTRHDPLITALFGLIRQHHPKLQNHRPGVEAQKILRGMAQIVDALNPARNRKSVAHPTGELLEEPEAMLVANAVRSLLHYPEYEGTVRTAGATVAVAR
jgi:Abortive infection C-terminus